MQTREYYLSRRFIDNKHFPYGFSRSGDFTIREVIELERFGSLYKALSEGTVINPSEDDELFLKVIAGEVESVQPEHKVWLKYLKRCKRAPVWLTTRRNEPWDDLEAQNDDGESFDYDYDEALEA